MGEKIPLLLRKHFIFVAIFPVYGFARSVQLNDNYIVWLRPKVIYVPSYVNAVGMGLVESPALFCMQLLVERSH